MLNSSQKLENAHQNEGYYSSKYELSLIEKSAEILLKNLLGNTVLELGCGIGVVTKILAKNNVDLTVVEQSQHFINQTKEKIGDRNVIFTNSSWEDYSPQKEFTDIVLFRGLDCVENIDLLLSEIKNKHQKSAYHFVITNSKSFHRIASEKMGMDNTNQLTIQGKNVGRVHNLCFDSVLELMEKHQLKIISWLGIGFKMFDNLDMDKQPDERFRAFIDMGDVAGKNAAELYFKVACK